MALGETMNTIKIKWLIAHEPEYLFLRTANKFAEEISARTDGRIEVEILTTRQYREQHGVDIQWPRQAVELVQKGLIEMSQTEVHEYSHYDKDFKVLDLPFLFRDHDHCTSVVEGEIGKQLCHSLSENSNMRGLAFTYSGGYRVIGTRKPVHKFEEIQDMHVRVNRNPVNKDVMESLGARATHFHDYGWERMAAGEIDAAETTYLRFQGENILKTNHSMFMTTIAMNKDFFNSLSADLQEAIEIAAFEAAKVERAWSIKDAEDFEKSCAEKGITITELDSEDKQRFYEATQSVYDKWTDHFSPGLIEKIRAH